MATSSADTYWDVMDPTMDKPDPKQNLLRTDKTLPVLTESKTDEQLLSQDDAATETAEPACAPQRPDKALPRTAGPATVKEAPTTAARVALRPRPRREVALMER